MKNNPLPKHGGPTVNAIKEYSYYHMVLEMEEVKIPMLIIHEKLSEYDLIKDVHDDCETYLSTPDGCQGLKECLHKLMNQRVVQISCTKDDIVISTP